ncbi:MAG: hypothetical protein M3Q07_26390 [Pseudobdellovibrionaceae bacterium]|nr:hypothetical protein [Pseudobdellovibrionaceae bacterium]
MLKWIISLLLFSSLIARSGHAETLEVDLENFPALQMLYLDDPSHAFEMIKKR